MVATIGDVGFVLSGGTSNSNPILSVGGNPSSYPITGLANNLFNDISPEIALAGQTDYRCIYIANNNNTYSLYDVAVFVSSEVADGCSVEIGIYSQNEQQKITIAKPVTSGHIILDYNDTLTSNINYNVNHFTWNQNFKNALDAIPDLSGINVSLSESLYDFTFILSFGTPKRWFELLSVDTNALSGTPNIEITKITSGSPINSIASAIPFPTTAPTGVVFQNTSSFDAISIGTLKPGDMCPIWIKRITLPDTTAVQNDGFSLGVYANPLSI